MNRILGQFGTANNLVPNCLRCQIRGDMGQKDIINIKRSQFIKKHLYCNMVRIIHTQSNRKPTLGIVQYITMALGRLGGLFQIYFTKKYNTNIFH